jgi:hypothetical protein
MTRKRLICILVVFATVAAATNACSEPQQNTGLSSDDLTALEVCNAVVGTFKAYSDSVWPGFDLASKPLIVYMPDKWALLLNNDGEAEGFTTYPSEWPKIHTNVLYHEGRYEDLAGQLAFGIAIGSTSVAAVPYTDKPAIDNFAFVVHENFHQFQSYDNTPAFGEIPWEREERYPIENVTNTALAYIEMRLLMDALSAMESGDEQGCVDNVEQFVAVRSYRWETMDSFIHRYEQGQEINEGTAKYVEKRSMDLLSRLVQQDPSFDSGGALSEEMRSYSMIPDLINDFKSRLTDSSISPEDMPRNRIYPVGAAEGLLADHFGIAWKEDAQKAGTTFAFVKELGKKLEPEGTDVEHLVETAKTRYDYPLILKATRKLIDQDRTGFDNELAKFNGQEGYRITIKLKSSGVWRSRSSSSKKWLKDKGRFELRDHFDIYSLSKDSLLIQVRDLPLLEENDWDNGIKTIVFYVGALDTLVTDGRSRSMVDMHSGRFQHLTMESEHLNARISMEGTFRREDGTLAIDLTQ